MNRTSHIDPYAPEPQATEPQRLRRAGAGSRKIAGVSAGLAAYSGRSVWLIRTLFVLLAIVGVGVVLYLALWAAIPTEDESRSPAQRHWDRRSEQPAKIAAVALVALAAVLIAPHAVGGAALIIAVVLLLHDRGRLRRKSAGATA